MLNLFNINGLSQNVNFCANKSSQTNKQTKEFLKKLVQPMCCLTLGAIHDIRLLV